MKIVTWNVNSVRLRLERLLALLVRHAPDVVCLQELKAQEADFPRGPLEAAGYQAAVFGQKTYNGVAILARQAIEEVERGFPGDPLPEQARVLSATIGGLRVVNLYVVNGESVGSEKYALKLRWLAALEAWLRGRPRAADPLLLVGDFNIAPDDRDVYDPELWRGRVLCSEAERAGLRALEGLGFVDLLRARTAGPGIYTWWDYRGGAFGRGLGLRIDLALGTAPVAARCTEVVVDRDERKESSGPGKPSDHAPLVVTLGASGPEAGS